MEKRINIAIAGTSGYIVESLVPYLETHITESVNIQKMSLRTGICNFDEIDVVIHAAGLVPGKETKVQDFYRINSDLTKTVAMQAKKAGVTYFIYLSTIAVYGRMPSIAFESLKELPEIPSTPYGESKLLAEKALNSFASDNFVVGICRVPDVYGGTNIDYLQRYINIYNKYKVIGINPKCYVEKKRSAVYIDNLCSCITAMIKYHYNGVCIPHDKDPISTFDYIRILGEINKYELRESRLCGIIIEMVNALTNRFDLFYGGFDLSDSNAIMYERISASEGCKKAIEDFRKENIHLDEY